MDVNTDKTGTLASPPTGGFTGKFTGESVRHEFPILGREVRGNPLVYLDNAATTQKPGSVIEAMRRYYERSNANVHRGLHALSEEATAAYEDSRRKVQRFINAGSPVEIIFTRGTTESINLVAASWGRSQLRAGDEILLTEMEHHSNLIPWQLLAREKNCTLRFIPFLEDGSLDLDALPRLWSERTRLVSLVHVSNVFGTINPLRKIIEFAHKRDVPVLVDSAQGVPHLPVDVQALDCDFLAFSGHKIYGPMGIGVLYAKEQLLEKMPPFMGGGEMIRAVWLDHATWSELPYKFEAGTPNVAGAVGLGAALDYIGDLGLEGIASYETELIMYALESLQKIPNLTLYGPTRQRAAVMAFNLGEIHPHDVAQFLDQEGIAVRAGHHCAQPLMRKLDVPATVRASFSFYNIAPEIDRLAEALNKTEEFFQHGL